MYEVLKAGGLSGGFNFDAKNRRPSNTYEDMFYAYILGMDTFALGLIKAAELIEDGELDEFVKKRYESFKSDLGQRIRSGNASLQELADIASKMGNCKAPESGRQEYLESIVNRILFG
jgi:xylose isomerase